jgi:hypothetical protein
MAETLAPLVYGTVVGRFLAMVADSKDDADIFPDAVPLTGSIVFTPEVNAVHVRTATPAPATVLPMPIKAELDAQGYISLNGVRGISLLASNDPSTIPSGFKYTVSFTNVRHGESIVRYADFPIEVLAGQTVDLTLVAPATGTGATVVVATTSALNQAIAEAETRIIAALASSGSGGSTGPDLTQEVADARFVADNAYRMADEGKSAAAAADQNADEAYLLASQGVSAAENAAIVAARAEGKADAASGAASTADGKAVAAGTAATGASSAAATADGKAVAAQATATNAASAASTADGKAVAAQTTATNAASAAATADGKAVTAGQAAAAAQATANAAYVKPQGGIVEADLASAVTSKLNAMPTVLVLASSTSTVPAGTPANTLVITPSAATA